MRNVFCLLLICLIAASCGTNKQDRKKTKPNIIFIYTDDHAYQAVSAYGSKVNKTPFIDSIAKDGIIFKNSFVTNSICGPCRAVIQTGKHSHINGFMANGNRFNMDQQTFPKILQKNGYQTALIGKWHLQSQPQGYDYWDILPGQGHYYNPEFINKDGKYTVEGYVTDVITDKTVKWLKERDKTKPFMLMMQHKAPHREWEPGPKYLTKYDGVKIPEPSNLFDDYKTRGTAAKTQDMSIETTMRLMMDNKVWELTTPAELEKYKKDPNRRNRWRYWSWKRTRGRMTKEQGALWDAAYGPKNRKFIAAKLTGKELISWKYQRYIKDYIRCIDSVDESVGQILKYLKKAGLEENTLVIYSSDQGFYLGEHGWFDKRFMYEESFRTPLVMKWPGVIKKGSVSNHLVQNLDYAQTFLEAAGVVPPADMQGKSMMPILEGKKVKHREALYYQYFQGPKSTHSVHRHYGVRTKDYKLIFFHELDEWEMYDMKKDPTEMNNIYKSADKKLIASLKKIFLHW